MIESQNLKLVDIRIVTDVAGISKSEVFRRIKSGRFPRPVKIGGGRCTRWELSEIQSWINERLKERNQSGQGA